MSAAWISPLLEVAHRRANLRLEEAERGVGSATAATAQESNLDVGNAKPPL